MMTEEIIERFSNERQLSERTKLSYYTSIKKYEEFSNGTLKEALQSAQQEEEHRVRFKDSKLRQNLIDFRLHLFKNYRESTAKAYFRCVKTIFKHFGYETSPLPSFNPKNSQNPTIPIMFGDLPTKDLIREAVNISNPLMKSMILFMSSSGAGRTECHNLTIGDFIEATADYHNERDISRVLEKLNGRKDVVGVWKIKRQKTNKYYYTLNTPESTSAIVSYLIDRKGELSNEDKLFKVSYNYITILFEDVNEKLGCGKIGSFNRFRCHTLRKFHASQLYNNTSFKKEQIDSMQGRSKDIIATSYFFENPYKLKEIYISGIDSLTIFDERNDVHELQKQVKAYQQQFIKQQVVIDEMQDVISSLKNSLI